MAPQTTRDTFFFERLMDGSKSAGVLIQILVESSTVLRYLTLLMQQLYIALNQYNCERSDKIHRLQGLP